MPPVSDEGIRSVRRTVLDSPAMALTSSTGPILRIIAGASSGSFESWPNRVCPARTSSRFVPNLSSCASRLARLDAEMPTTETNAAMPMAMPNAVSTVLAARAPREPTPTRMTSVGRKVAVTRTPPTTSAVRPAPLRVGGSEKRVAGRE